MRAGGTHDEPRLRTEPPAAARRGGRRGRRRGARRPAGLAARRHARRLGMAPALARLARESVALRFTGERLPPPTTWPGSSSRCSTRPTCRPCSRASSQPPARAGRPPGRRRDPRAGRVGAGEHRPHREQRLWRGAGGRQRLLRLSDARRHQRPRRGRQRCTRRHDRRRGSIDAVVVAFDPDADLALLFVPDARAPALELSHDGAATRHHRGRPRLPRRRPADGHPGRRDGIALRAAARTSTGRAQRAERRRDARPDPARQQRRTAGDRAGRRRRRRLRRVAGHARTSATRSAPTRRVDLLGPSIGSTSAVDTGACL